MIDLSTVALNVVAAGGGGAVVAYALFRTLGAKWLDSRFANQLEKVRQAHATEIEHLRFRIAGLLDRTTKLNQREFDILPDIWGKADEAHYATLSMIAIFQTGTDLSNMTDSQLEWFLEKSALTEWQKDELRSKGKYDRTTYYSEIERWDRVVQASKASQAFSQAVSKGSIYIHPESLPRIDAFAERIRKVVFTYRWDVQMRRDGDFERREKDDDPVHLYRETGQKDFDELGQFLRTRYWKLSLDGDTDAIE